ncbi:tudor domain-containing protein 3 isoform X1 [Neodiprion virginianus]|uniref:tudor domain-containing protein 3 isoform X1 n=1 Tax=Neodiprion virginianus TaxID=2961670 RepID=UPI001EE72571|nr:tudor domain-containing protein 3 isoform X1 [Neodiprion virginianus]
MDELRAQGWYLSDEGYNLLGDTRDVQKIIKKALDYDLKEISSGQGDLTQGNVVWQIQKLRNVAAPKGNEESRSTPRLLKLSLTDGQNNFQAIEIEPISSLSINTPPGTKLLMKKGVLSISHGIILLKPSHIFSVLGGKVPSLVEKWEMNKKLAQHTRVRPAEEGGPPPWIPFGKKIIKISEQDKNFKALADKERASKENAEFEAQRKDAIAEAAKQGSKKVFGGGNKQLLDHSVQRIVDQGYSIEQAEYALKLSRNNVDRALRSLQRNDNRYNKEPGDSTSAREVREPKGKRFEKKVEDGKPSSGRVSLFDFLEDKLPAQTDLPEETKPQGTNDFYTSKGPHDRFESRSTDQIGRGGRNPRGGRSYQPAPRYSEEVKSSKPKLSKANSAAVQYPQYNSANTSSNQRKPPRFQKSQENSTATFQHENNYKMGFNKSSHFPDSKNGIAPPRLESSSENGNNRNRLEQQGNNYNNNRQQNHYQAEPKPREKQDHNPYNPNVHNRTNTIYQTHKNTSIESYQNPNGSSSEQNYRNRQNRNLPTVSNGRYNSKETGSLNEQKGGGNNNNQLAIPQAEGMWVWQPGDKCMAKYWEDNRYYNAEVTAVSHRTCVVLFKDFNNFEEVLQADCIPITIEDGPILQDGSRDFKQHVQRGENRQQRNNQGNHITTGMEFRRGGGGSGTGTRGYNRRSQHRSTRPIYQPPGQRNHSPSRAQKDTNSAS